MKIQKTPLCLDDQFGQTSHPIRILKNFEIKPSSPICFRDHSDGSSEVWIPKAQQTIQISPTIKFKPENQFDYRVLGLDVLKLQSQSKPFGWHLTVRNRKNSSLIYQWIYSCSNRWLLIQSKLPQIHKYLSLNCVHQ